MITVKPDMEAEDPHRAERLATKLIHGDVGEYIDPHLKYLK